MKTDKKYLASCHCGNAKVAVSDKPTFMHDCNCSLCSKSGSVWGYFKPVDVQIDGSTESYTRNDYPEPAVEIHFCENCGSTTHWILTAAHVASTGHNDQMGVNMRLFDSDDLEGVELRFPDGKNWSGKSEFGFRRQSVILGEGFTL